MLPLIASVALGLTSNPVHPSRLLVKLREGAPPREIATLHRQLGARVLRDLPQIHWQIVEVSPSTRDEARASYAAHSTIVERADLDGSRSLAYTPNDPYWPGMYHLQMIGADTAWDTTKGSPSILIGVIDTGLETTHPDIAANVWTNPGEIAGNGIDDDGNGFIDDVHGYDFAYNDNDPNDAFGHGTACAGIIAAIQDNNLGVTGIAPHCKVAGVKAAIDSGYLYDSAVVPAIVYATDIGCDVLSMSFYGDQVTPAERDAIDYAWAHDVVPVAAAGNDARVFPYYPAAYENTIAVAALDTSFNKAWFSNWGSWVDVAAPGLSVSTITTGGGYTTGFAGTSAACPHVAGVVALLRSAYPAAANWQIRNALENGAIPVTQSGIGEYTGYGRIWAPASLACGISATCSTGAPRFHFMAPCGGGPIQTLATSTTSKLPPWIVYGTHFDRVVNARLLFPNFVPLQPIVRTRNEIEVIGGSNYAPSYIVALNNNSQLIPISWEAGEGWHYAPSDIGTNGTAVATGAFLETYANDGVVATCTARNDGVVYAEFVIRKVLVPDVESIELRWKRAYSNVSGTETIEFYDWSTWSFPYGNFVTASSQPVSSGAATSSLVALPANPARFIDDEGTMYVRLTTSGAASNGSLALDSFKVVVR